MVRSTISAIIILSLLAFISCGNLMNDELSGEENNPADIIPGNGSYGSSIGNKFTASGRVRIQSAENDGYFISGTIYGDSGREEIWLSNIDKNANRKWSASLKNISTNDRISRIEVIDKDNILILADRYYTLPGPDDLLTVPEPDLIMIKVNSSTGIVWQKCIGSAKKDIVYSTAPANDGGLLAAGITVTMESAGTAAEYRPFVIRVSPQGEVIWKKDYKIYLNKAEKKYFEIVIPSEIISLGNEEYLLSGTALNPDNNKLVGFYCKIDGRAAGYADDNTAYGGGILLKSCYIKAGNKTISMLGNISYNDRIVSVIGVTGTVNSSTSTTSAKYTILTMNKETLKVSSKKNYEFESFKVQKGIIRNNTDDFTLAGMIKPVIGKGIYTITFDKSGTIKELHTKYYDDSVYDFISVEFNGMYENSGLAYIIRWDNPGSSKELYIDRYISSSVSKSSMLKVVVVVTPDPVPDDADLEENDNDADIEDSAITDNDNPGLVFSRY